MFSGRGGEPPPGPVEGYDYGLLGYPLLVPWGTPGGEGQLATPAWQALRGPRFPNHELSRERTPT